MTPSPTRLRIAIIGGDPSGLAAAISLARLPYVDWALYEKKPTISETGGGISIQQHTWRMLEHLGVAQHIVPDDFHRPSDGCSGQQRDGRTGELVRKSYHPADVPTRLHSGRVVRATLQNALLREVDQRHIYTDKRLVSITQLPDNKLLLTFSTGFTDTVDLVLGADGIRSVVRQAIFPGHQIAYTGQSAYRAIISTADVLSAIPDIPLAPVCWHGDEAGKYVFTCPLGR